MTIADMPAALAPSAAPPYRPGATGAVLDKPTAAAASDSPASVAPGPQPSDRQPADDIRRAQAWLADRQIGPIV